MCREPSHIPYFQKFTNFNEIDPKQLINFKIGAEQLDIDSHKLKMKLSTSGATSEEVPTEYTQL